MKAIFERKRGIRGGNLLKVKVRLRQEAGPIHSGGENSGVFGCPH
jgi:hypothetical protein